MLGHVLAVIAIVLVAVLALSVRLFFGKPFVHTDIKGNAELERRGLNCVIEEEMRTISQAEGGHRANRRSKQIKKTTSRI